MPRNKRIDIPGAIHHVIVRGAEKRKIFLTDKDCSETKTLICFWGTMILGLTIWSLGVSWEFPNKLYQKTSVQGEGLLKRKDSS